jgi:hypothetical protein
MEGGFVLFQVLIVLTLMDAIMPCTCQFLNWARPVPPAPMLQRVLYISNVAGGPVMNKLPLPPSFPLSLHHRFDLGVFLHHDILHNTQQWVEKLLLMAYFVVISSFGFVSWKNEIHLKIWLPRR